jgi:hypothetical protein
MCIFRKGFPVYLLPFLSVGQRERFKIERANHIALHIAQLALQFLQLADKKIHIVLY